LGWPQWYFKVPGYNHFSLELQAEQTAKNAAEKLKKERLQVSTMPLSQPTWTGKHGIAGAPEKKRFGQVKRGLTPSLPAINNMAVRGPMAGPLEDKSFFGSRVCGLPSLGGAAVAPLCSSKLLADINNQTPDRKVNEEKLIDQIRAYLVAKEGQATSQQLVQHFKPQLPANSSLLFKKMLQEIANFNKKMAFGN